MMHKNSILTKRQHPKMQKFMSHSTEVSSRKAFGSHVAAFAKFLMHTIMGVLLVGFHTMPSFSITGNEPERQRRSRAARNAELQEIRTTLQPDGVPLIVSVERGTAHNHPLMAIWIEDLEGNYIQTLFVAQSIAKGTFAFGDPSSGKWMPGPIQRPASLPYWAHKRGIKSETGWFVPHHNDPMPDAITGATPKAGFRLVTQIPNNIYAPFNVLLEINQSWDWNYYWTNNKFPHDMQYFSSAQPAVVYRVTLMPGQTQTVFHMLPIGHSHWNGSTGELFTNLSTITTALQIVRRATVTLGN